MSARRERSTRRNAVKDDMRASSSQVEGGKNLSCQAQVMSKITKSMSQGEVPSSVVPEPAAQNNNRQAAPSVIGSVKSSHMPPISNGSISSRQSSRSNQSRISQIEKHRELAKINEQQRQVALKDEEEKLRIEEARLRLEEKRSQLKADAEKARLEEEKRLIEIQYADDDQNDVHERNSEILSHVPSDFGNPQDVAIWLNNLPPGGSNKQQEHLFLQHAEQRQENMAIPVTAPQFIKCSNFMPPGSTQHKRTESTDSAQNLADAIVGAFEKIQFVRQNEDMKHFAARNTGAKDLPEFHGDPEDWPMFWSRFQNSTKMCGFSNEDNIVRLQRCLRGKAKQSVLSMLSSNCKLEDITDVLKKRFGRPDQIIKGMLERAKTAPAPTEGDFQGLLDFSIVVKNFCATAENLQLPLYLNNPQLLEEFRRKLPSHLQLEWGRHIVKTGGIPDLRELSNFLDEVSSAAVFVCDTPSSHSRKQKQREQCMVVSEVGCPLKCDKDHHLSNCPKFKHMKYDERWTVAKKGFCFICLKKGHRSPECPISKPCGLDGCNKLHHQLLHSHRSVNFERKEKPNVPDRQVFGVISNINTQLPSVLMEIAPVILSSSSGEVLVNAFLDGGSSCTMLEETVAKQLGLDGKSSPLHLSWQGKKTDVDRNSRIVSLKIRGLEEQEEHDLIDIRTKNELHLPITPVRNFDTLKKWQHLKDVPFPRPLSQPPKIVIGKDHQHLILPRKAIEGQLSTPAAMWTKLGWVIGGPTRKKSTQQLMMMNVAEDPDENLHEMVKSQFRLDALGVVNCPKPPQSKENERAEKLMEEFTQRVAEDRWETGLLWKTDAIALPESYSTAMRRLKILERKMDKYTEYAELYEAKIQEYLQKEFCRKITPKELSQDNGQVWYLPHFGVTNPNKPGKLRLVFDCAAQSHGMSINDAWLQGPDLMRPLTDVSLKFREKEVAFSGDIRDMFHMVQMRKKDVPSVRFLWRGKERIRTPDIFVMQVLLFGGVGSPYQAQYVKNKNAEEFVNQFPEAAKAIIERHYMDDYLDSCSTVEESIKKISEVREIHRRGGFEIRNWLCNKKEVLQVIEPSQVNTQEILTVKEDRLERVLGLYWNPSDDVYKYTLKLHKVDKRIITGEIIPTKRQLLQLIMSLFDPLGFIVHLTVRGRILLQEVWKSAIGWDEKLSSQLEPKWKTLVLQILKIPEVEIPRCLAPNISGAIDLQLHVFCDASQQAFCAVAYLRATGRGGEVTCNIVMAKARVAPIKCTSIPRLEMEAALMGARLGNYLKKNLDLKLSATVFCTDSRNVLCWLRAADPSRFKMYVANRIGEILDTTDVRSWKWVPTAHNVADDATRDAVPAETIPESRWFRGPDFLWKPEERWPVEKESELSKAKVEDLEMKKVCCMLVTEVESLMEVKNYSSLRRLVRVTAWILRLKKNLLTKKREERLLSRSLSVDEIREGENYWIRRSQEVSFHGELDSLKEGKVVGRTSRLYLLSPILVNGVICVKSRLVNAPNISEQGRFPVILDSKDALTKLLVAWYHHVHGHHGIEMICNEIRQRYWILGLKSAVKKAAKECLECQMTAAKQIIPEMAALPEVRVRQPSRPFTFVGVDYFGPISVVNGRKREKRYGALFTCLSTRAVHLEVAFSLSTDDFIMALHRFIGRRGEPEEIRSDNGTNFRGAEAELKKSLREMEQQKIDEDLTGRGVKWTFNPPGAPHMGGAWERLARSVKTAMYTILKNRTLNDQLLSTVLVEAEVSVNSRPLTIVSNDKDDPAAITPNCFLMGTTSVRQPPGVFGDQDLCLRKRWRHVQVLANHFWSRWLKEYLPSLALRGKWNRATPDVTVGELVFVADLNQQRNMWTKGVVDAVYPGKDNHVRVVVVRTAEGVLRRPVAKLFRVPRPQDGDSNQ